jgi:flagellin-like protein
MRKLFKSKKALSPVVAAIILIAVTVAVSIAVAAWMGALTFTFMQTEELKIQGHTWDGSTPVQYIDLSVKNTGTSALTLSSARVNNVAATSNITSAGFTLQPGSTATVRVDGTFTSGAKYEFTLITATGNKYPYTVTAP